MGNVVVEAILGGEADGIFDEVVEAVKQREKILAKRMARTLDVGAMVRIKGVGTGGKYLNGLVAKVEKVNQTTVSLTFEGEDREKARRYGSGVRMPMNLVEIA